MPHTKPIPSWLHISSEEILDQRGFRRYRLTYRVGRKICATVDYFPEKFVVALGPSLGNKIWEYPIESPLMMETGVTKGCAISRARRICDAYASFLDSIGIWL